MKKTLFSLFVALSLTATLSSFSTTNPVPPSVEAPSIDQYKRPLKEFTGPGDTPEIFSATMNSGYLDIYILVPNGREPESLQIRSISDTWINGNLFNGGDWTLSFPYVDAYNRQCWHFTISLAYWGINSGDTYVLRFTDWTLMAADDYTVVY